MAAELKDDDAKSDDEQNDDKYKHYSLTISIIKNRLELHLHDTKTKYMYHGSFDANVLQKAGFSAKQSSNLESICKFIESARKGHQQLQFEISIEKMKILKLQMLILV